MTVLRAVVLGLVQGITEFLPGVTREAAARFSFLLRDPRTRTLEVFVR